MDRPSEQKKPEYGGEAELNHRHHEPPLKQLSEAGHEETAQCSDDVPCGSLSRHGDSSR
jgi:hypothetical protein